MSFAPASLRVRLVAGAVALGMIFALIFGAFAVWRFQRAEDDAIRTALLSRYDVARDEVTADGLLRQDADSPRADLVQIISPDGTVIDSSAAMASLPALVDVTGVSGSGAIRRIGLQDPDVDLAVLARRIALTSSAGAADAGVLVVAVDAEGFNTATSDLVVLLVAGLATVVVAMGVLSWFLTGRALASVARLTERAERLGPQELTDGLPVPSGDAELARLVRALNRMLLRLHDAHATELAFAADAGHRLRTPIATLRAEAELALEDPDPWHRTTALERIVGDADQLTSIVDRMLARNRAAQQLPEPVLASLREAEARWRRQAELSDVALDVAVSDRIAGTISCRELIETLEPILDNALRHTSDGGRVVVSADLDAAKSEIVVEISNTGRAIPADIIPRLFDAWVSTRDASIAGGLGLWLAREAARDLGGDVDLLNNGDPVTTFRVKLPAHVS